MKDTIQKENKNINKKSLVFKAERDDYFNIKNTLADLDSAIISAESIDYPNRYYLLMIYHDIMKDPHLKSVIKHRKTRLKALKHNIIKSNGKVDDKSTILFNQTWFKKFLDYTIDAFFYGNSLIEIQNNKGSLEIILIPRENVIPEFQELKVYPTNQSGDLDYSAPIYSKSLVDVNNDNNSRNLGDFLEVSKLLLMKNEVILNWSQFIELFGQPIRMATSDSEDPVEINQIMGYLKELGRSGYLVKNSQTDVEFLNNQGKGVNSTLYQNFEKYVNEEVSKHIIGGTMLTDDGSSRSQSEVHQAGSFIFTKADMDFLLDIINNQLIPLLQKQGLIIGKNLEFKFIEPEVLTIEQKLQVDQFILDNFTVKDIKYFETRYNVDLVEVKEIEEPIKEEEDGKE